MRPHATGTALRVWASALALMALAACGASAPPAGTGAATGTRADSAYQDRLDALGIPLTLPPGRVILVNIPAYELIAFEDGMPVLRSRVIVGSPVNQTPRVDTYTTRVLFHPSWRPPRDMIESGELPDMLVPPGPNNPMGLAAIVLEPGMDEYLHDTGERHLFDRERRALSHGCVRVERWAPLVAWLLERDEDWVRSMAEAPSSAMAAPPVPVLLRYLTVFPAADGTLRRHADVYGLESGDVGISLSTMDAAQPCAPGDAAG